MKKQKLFSGKNTNLNSIQLTSLGRAAADDDVIGLHGCYAGFIMPDAQTRVLCTPDHRTLENHAGETEPSCSCDFKTPVLRIPLLKNILEKDMQGFLEYIFLRTCYCSVW